MKNVALAAPAHGHRLRVRNHTLPVAERNGDLLFRTKTNVRGSKTFGAEYSVILPNIWPIQFN